MNYLDFKDKHKGEKVIVCGCGVSATELKNPQDYTIIGVNDLSRLFIPNYLVVLNDKSSFTSDRWQWIEKTESPYIFTHIKKLPITEDKKVLIQLGKYGGHDLEKTQVDYTSNSPYLAVIIAAYMGFNKIGLLGADFVHHHFFEKSGEHTLNKKINLINNEYKMLHQTLKNKGIELVNLSSVSKIEIPRQSLEDF